MPYGALLYATAAAAPVTTAGAPLVSVGDTLLDFRTELMLQLGGRGDVLPARQNKWINWGYRSLAAMIDLSELRAGLTLALVAGQPLYKIPVQVSVAKHVSIIDSTNYAEGGRLLDKIDLKSYRMQDAVTTSEEPRAWFRYSRMIVFWPTPIVDRTAALDFKIRPDDMVNDTDSPIIPVEWHEALLLAARSRAERSLRQFAASKETWNDMLTIIRPIINTDAEEAGTQTAKVYAPKMLRRMYRGRR